MKLLKTLTVGLLAASAVGTASAAPIVIHVAGSTAFRSAASVAIVDTLSNIPTTGTSVASTGGGQGTGDVYVAYTGDASDFGSASYAIFANGTIGSGGTASVIVEATWTGSLSGVVDVAAGVSANQFLNETASDIITAVNSGDISNANITAGSTSASTNPSTTAYQGATKLSGTGPLGISGSYTTALPSGDLTTGNKTVELAFSDADQATIAKELNTGSQSGTIGAYSTISGLSAAIANTSNIIDAGTLGATDVGIVPFVWVFEKVSGGYVPPTNISENAARSLITNGYIAQALLTGGNATADTANYFYLIGRNEDSGTRIASLAESQFGVTANPKQYIVGDDGTTFTGSWSVTTPSGTTSGSGIQLYPTNASLNTENQIYWPYSGHSGYAGGANVRAVLNLANPGTSLTFNNEPGLPSSAKAANNSGASYFIGLLGITDAYKISGNNLSYNGVAFSSTAIQNGSYSLWFYEHAYRLKNISSVYQSAVDGIADNVYYYDADIVDDSKHYFSHAESSTGVYSNSANGPSPAAGLFDDGFFYVQRDKTEYNDGAVSHK